MWKSWYGWKFMCSYDPIQNCSTTAKSHLVCIAPWEGTTDIYRESIYEGGVPALAFNRVHSKQFNWTWFSRRFS